MKSKIHKHLLKSICGVNKTKYLTLIGIMTVGLLPGTMYAQDHHHHDTHQHNESHHHDGKTSTSDEFQKQLSMVYDTYISLKEAFIKSDASQVKTKAVDVENQLRKVDMKLLEGQAHMSWMNQLKTMNEGIKTMKESSDIGKQRSAFSTFSDALYASIKEFGVTDMNVYRQHCPMALDNKGAYWLSTNKKIRNPYFGDMMLSCGSTKETLSEN